MAEFFTDEANLAELVSHMPEDDQHRFHKYGHFRLEPAFVDRIFIAYSPTGLTHDKQHRPPDIITTIKVKDFQVDPREGCIAVLEDSKFKQELTITHVPKQVFGLQIYMSIPPRLQLRWDARRLEGGKIWRSLSFVFLIKARNRSDFYSRGNHYLEAPNVFRKLYPNVTPQPFKF